MFIRTVETTRKKFFFLAKLERFFLHYTNTGLMNMHEFLEQVVFTIHSLNKFQYEG
jgi:hypothetical protein